ncbi:MAG: mobile mystery protein A [Gemmatimonadaceae bacterium]
MPTDLSGLRRRQIDSLVGPLRTLAERQPPRRGWVSEIRHAIGMTGRQLAQRLGISQPGLVDLEHNEAQEKITLATLRAAANALDCDLVYALVPRRPLEDVVRARLRERAEREVSSVAHSMALEAQSVMELRNREQIEELIKKWADRPPRDLWD